MPLCLCSFLSPLFASSPSLVLLHLLFSFSPFQSAYILSPFQLAAQKVGYVTRVTDLYSESLVRKCSKCQISFLRKSWETRGIGWKELITTYIFVEKETRSKGNFHFHTKVDKSIVDARTMYLSIESGSLLANDYFMRIKCAF